MTLAERLAHALTEGRRRSPELLDGDDPALFDNAEPAPAAVLVAVTDRPEPGVILTQRPLTMRSHPGQIAFPGGRIDPTDADAVAAALREAEEEIALPPARVEVVGTADTYRSHSGYLITPVIGVVPPDLPLVPHEREVAAIFEVPLRHLLDPAMQVERRGELRGVWRSYYEIEWNEHSIWGITAAILVNLTRRLALPA